MPPHTPHAATPPPDAEPGAAPRRRGWPVALLGLIGALALALPLTQVLRFQVDALAEHRSERTRLDPLATAMAVHQGLAGHAEVAGRVLRGRSALEPERREREAGVDRGLAALQQTLEAGGWPPATREAAVMQADWRRLVAEITQRRIDASASHRSHRLLQEQVLQVMDLVLALQGGSTRRALAALPHVHWPAFVAARQHELMRLEARADASRQAAWAGLVVLGSTALLLATGWAGASRPAPGGQAAPTARRGHGRRAGDGPTSPTPAAIAESELQSLRRSAENTPSGG